MRKVTTATRAATLGMLAALLCGPVSAETPDNTPGAVSAVWTAKQVRFVYLGFTSKYSCDGLADRVRSVLLLLGARKDLQVSPGPCSSPYGRPDPFPGVNISMNVLEPADSSPSKSDKAPAETVPAHWKLVDVNAALARDPLWQAGQCELLEQVKQSILPKFSTRNVQYSSTSCVPNQLYLGATQLKAEILVPDEPKASAPAAPAPAPAAGPR
jgi:hypothetical protein